MTINIERDDILKVRIDAVTLSMMDTARGYLGLDKSKFIRQSVREKAAAVVAEHQKTRFSVEDWASFFKAMNAPAAPTERMTRAVHKFREITG